MVATDIDVLTWEYHTDFHVTQGHYECKGGKVQVLDRVMWLVGVRMLLDADASYLVSAKSDREIVQFARDLHVDVLSIDNIDSVEGQIGIQDNQWLARSNYPVFDKAKSAWRDRYQEKNPSDEWKTLKSAIQMIEIDSWRLLSYGAFNRLIRTIEALSTLTREATEDSARICARYALGAAIVRFTQYLLWIARDISTMQPGDFEDYLSQKLIFGNNNPDQAVGLIESTLHLVDESLKATATPKSHGVDVARLTNPPACCSDLVKLLRELLSHRNSARFLPLAMEFKLFGSQSQLDAFESLKLVCGLGEDSTAMVCGFLIRSLGVDSSMLESCLSVLESKA
tara:strand:+ start:1970 stop:2989 length:1020 start_codon:yes stop_codon:yes gene_type:complete